MAVLTVAILTYNRCEYLVDAVNSVRQQTYSNIKIIIYDNASTDDTEKIVKKFMQEDERIYYVRQPMNIGSGENFNMALDKCDTDYLAIFHDDDIMLPDMLEIEIKAMSLHHNAIMCAQAKSITTIDFDGNLINKGDFSNNTVYYETGQLIEDNIKRCSNILVCPTAMFNMQLMNKFKIRVRLDRGIAADWILWMEINLYGAIVGIEKDLIRYRIHSSSDTQSSSAERWAEAHWHVQSWLIEQGHRSKIDGLIQSFRNRFVEQYINEWCAQYCFDKFSVEKLLINLNRGIRKYDLGEANDKYTMEHILKNMVKMIASKKCVFSDYFNVRKVLLEAFEVSRCWLLFKELDLIRKYYIKKKFSF